MKRDFGKVQYSTAVQYRTAVKAPFSSFLVGLSSIRYGVIKAILEVEYRYRVATATPASHGHNPRVFTQYSGTAAATNTKHTTVLTHTVVTRNLIVDTIKTTNNQQTPQRMKRVKL